MKTIKNEEFGGERPLYNVHDLRLENVTIHAGESALKECTNIEAIDCRFEGKYPFWENDGFKIKNCYFSEGGRAAIWYSRNMIMEDTLVDAPKMFREMENMEVRNVTIPNALETLWMCRNVKLHKVEVDKADYLFMHSSDIDIDDYKQNGNYSFQYCKNVVIRNATIYSKDAFWNTENVTVYDSYITGEYLGWYSNNLRLINCRIGGTQALCYAHGLIMENCVMDEDADLCFEYSDLHAEIKGHITSIKNPRSGKIVCDSVGEIILDENIKQPADCEIVVRNSK